MYLFPLITKTKKRDLKLLGSNMGFIKEIIYKINGFNEEYQSPGVGEDSDLEWRFKKVNAKYIALKNTVVEYHLWHSTSGKYDVENNFKIMNENIKKEEWYCIKGIKK